MSPILLAGTIIVQLALISYSIGVITEQRKKIITKNVLMFLLIGVILDVTATVCMISGSKNSPFTPHGILGYSSLLAMLIDTVLIWQLKVKNGVGSIVPAKIHLYSRIAYIWWILAYVTGAMLVMMKHAK